MFLLQVRKLKHRAVKSLRLGCTVFKWQSWDSDSNCLLPLFAFLSKMLYCPLLWGETSNRTNGCPLNAWPQNIDKGGEIWDMSHDRTLMLWNTMWYAVDGNTDFILGADCAHVFLLSPRTAPPPSQSVSTCSPASGTTVLITACMGATAERLSRKVCLSCMVTEASTMTRSSRLSKHSMKQSGM